MRAAKIGIYSALVGALIGAIIAGLFTFLTTNRQIAAESQRSRADFIRTQRQIAYTAFLNDFHTLEKLSNDLFVNIGIGDELHRANAYFNYQKDSFTAEEKVYHDLNSVQLVSGTNSVRGLGANLLDDAAQVSKEVSTLYRNTPTVKSTSDFDHRKFDAFEQSELADLFAFVAAARSDIAG